MELNLMTASGNASKKTVEVSEVNFGKEFNEALVHQVVTAYLAGARAGTRAHKNRHDVSGGGAKPWRQKGTGRARAGTIRSPLWRSGGKTFAARPKDWTQKVNRKMYRGALRAILSELVRQERLLVIDKIALEMPKTKELADKLKTLGLDDVLIVSEDMEENLYLASRNLYQVGVCDVAAIDPVCLIRYKKVLMSVAALKKIEEMLA